MAEPQRVPTFRPGEHAVFVPDHKSFGEFMLSEQMRDVVADVAGAIANLAGRYAPRRKDRGRAPDGTEMADRFEVNREAGTLAVGKAFHNVRVKVDVFNEAPSAAPNEFGNKRNKRYRMLGRAGAAYGEFKPEGGLQA
jgi:hypothetical protein